LGASSVWDYFNLNFQLNSDLIVCASAIGTSSKVF
jgi:hypothetical protein